MSTSPRQGRPALRRALRKVAAYYAAAAAVCLVVGAVYTLFGHGVTSWSMSFMFGVPLAGGLWYLLLSKAAPEAGVAWSRRAGGKLFSGGIAILTVQCLLRGILDIAGRTSEYLPAYLWAGGGCLALSLGIFAATALRAKRRGPKN